MVAIEYIRFLERRELSAIFNSGYCLVERMLRFKLEDGIYTLFQPLYRPNALELYNIDGTIEANWVPLLDPEKYPDCIPVLFSFKKDLTKRYVVSPLTRIPVIGVLIKMPVRQFFPEACVWKMNDFNLFLKNDLPQTGIGIRLLRTLENIKSEESVESLSDEETGGAVDDDINVPVSPFDDDKDDDFDVLAFVQSWED